MNYEQAKARWMRCVAALYPQFGIAAVGQQLASMGAGSRGPASHSGARLGPAAGQTTGHSGAGVSTGGGNSGYKPVGHKYTPARYQGMAVCFGYNSAAGCRRLATGSSASTCSDGKTHFAHVCNYFVKANNVHCLAQHSKIGNH